MRLLLAEQLREPAEGADESLAVRYVRSYSSGSSIANVCTQLALLDTGFGQFPVSINNGDEPTGNSYVVSPTAAYGGYAEYELRQLGKPLLAWPLIGLAKSVGTLLQAARIDRIVYVNNWLLSTNLYPPDWNGDELPEITHFLCGEFPDHAIGFRSLNARDNPQLLQKFLQLGYMAIPSRQVYFFDGRHGEESHFLKSHNCRMDAKLLRSSAYRIVSGQDFSDADFTRAEELYSLLYLDKYCCLNPQYRANWLRQGLHEGWLEFRALKNPDGHIDGVVGWFASAHTLTAPIVGYDTGLPQKRGLYRMLTQLCLQQAARQRMVLNFSSGAAHFKRLRGGQPAIEYSLLYLNHLPSPCRVAWTLLSSLLHGIGVPLMKRMKL